MNLRLRLAGVALVATLGAVLPARAASGYDLSDMWWDPQESGWGVQFTQQRDVIVADLYVQGPDSRPVWYAAELYFLGLAPQTHEMTYSGDLYEAPGTWFGAAAYGGAVRRKVGTMTVVAPTMTAATLSYSVDGIAVTKSIQRYTFRYEQYDGTYAGTHSETWSKCDNPAENGTRTEHPTYVFSLVGMQLTIQATASGRTCTYTGPYTQAGQLGRVEATYTCTNGDVGALTFEEMNVQRYGLIGLLFGANNRGCHIDGSFAAVLQ